jgi:hypothetical protein
MENFIDYLWNIKDARPFKCGLCTWLHSLRELSVKVGSEASVQIK